MKEMHRIPAMLRFCNFRQAAIQNFGLHMVCPNNTQKLRKE